MKCIKRISYKISFGVPLGSNVGPMHVKMARQRQSMVGGDFDIAAKTQQIGLLSHFQASQGSVETKSCSFQTQLSNSTEVLFAQL